MRALSFQQRARAAGAIALATLACVGCEKPESTAASEEIVVQVAPFAVIGQVEGAEYLGRAMAESLTAILAQSRDLRVLDVPTNPDSASGEATRLLKGSVIREPEGIRAKLRLFRPGSEEPLWETEISSDDADLTGLTARLSRETLGGLAISLPRQYDHIFDLTGGPEMSASELTSQARRALRRNDVAGFLTASTELVERFPEDSAAQALNAMALLLHWDAVPTSEKTLEQLRDRLAELERIDPATPYDEFLRAYIYRSSGRPDRARKLYSAVLARTDLSVTARAWALRQRAYTYLQAGDAAAARDDAERAVGLDPANASSLAALSKALEVLGRTDEAVQRSQQAVALESNSWRQHQRMGVALIRAGKLDEAARAIDRACQIGKSQEACANLAVALQRDGRESEASEAAAHSETLEASRWGLYNLACYRSLNGQTSLALETLRRSVDLGFADLQIKSDPDLETVRSEKGFAEIVASVEERLSMRQKLLNSAFPWQT